MTPPPRNPGLLASGPTPTFVLVPFFVASAALTLFLLRRPLRNLSQLFRHLCRRRRRDDDGAASPLRRTSLEERDLESACNLSELKGTAGPPSSPSQAVRLRPLRRPEPLRLDQPRYIYCTDPNCQDDDKASLLSPELDLYFDPEQPDVARYHSKHHGRRSITYEEIEEREPSGWEVLVGREPGSKRGRVEGAVSKKIERAIDCAVDWAMKLDATDDATEETYGGGWA